MRAADHSFGRTLVIFLSVLTAGCLFLAGCSKPAGDAGAENAEETTKQPGGEWFYDSFSDVQKMAYDAFRKASVDPFSGEPVLICDEKGNAAKIPVKDLDMVYQGFLYDHPEVFWLGQTYNYRVCSPAGENESADAVSVNPIPSSEAELKAQKEEFGGAAKELLEGLEDTGSSRDKARALYDRLAAGTEYEEEALYDPSLQYQHTAFGAVADRKAVCDGIALAYKYLLGRCGIRCIVIPGESSGAAHVWNTVFWDGEWHETDLTWDTASRGNDSGQYFDLTTEEMSKDHIREAEGIALAIPVSE